MLLSISAYAADKHQLTNLNQLKWKSRIVIVDQRVDDFSARAKFIKNEFDINERNVIWVIIGDQLVSSNYPAALSQELAKDIGRRLLLANAKVILIGKDGSIKLRQLSFDN
jgi:hypothetical protein